MILRFLPLSTFNVHTQVKNIVNDLVYWGLIKYLQHTDPKTVYVHMYSVHAQDQLAK